MHTVCGSQVPQGSVPLVKVQVPWREEDRDGEDLQSSSHIKDMDAHSRYTFLTPLAPHRGKLGHPHPLTDNGCCGSELSSSGSRLGSELGVDSIGSRPLPLLSFPSFSFLLLFSFPFFFTSFSLSLFFSLPFCSLLL